MFEVMMNIGMTSRYLVSGNFVAAVNDKSLKIPYGLTSSDVQSINWGAIKAIVEFLKPPYTDTMRISARSFILSRVLPLAERFALL